ncbi:sulfotransferase [Haloferula rosea]|uniref:Sulfotransferase n=1 Tax=Haloferula rosea TaxID=490093 RepID=A0A934RC45_9BACT|nr:sulfotransferase [Haloferula rosea]MBK1827815.1 sulfotransferase [Haloferula rosea]
MQHAFVISEPRSGSTVLTAMLDRRKGVLSMPESSFPQVLGYLKKHERTDPRRLAAIYLGSTFVPTPLKFSEIESCMTGNDRDVLNQLAEATAGAVGRDPRQLNCVIWKTVRTIGMHQVLEDLDAKVVILRRHPHNVFESQSRFSYGVRNRKPFRYAIFRQSYEAAFTRLAVSERLEIEYDDLPEALSDICGFLEVPDLGIWPDDSSHFAEVAGNCNWLSEVTREFQNRDLEKRARLDDSACRTLDHCLSITRPLRFAIHPLRRFFDRRSLGHVRQIADRTLKKETAPEE